MQCPQIKGQADYSNYPAAVRATMDLLLMMPGLQDVQKQGIEDLVSHLEERSVEDDWQTTQVFAAAACRFAGQPDSDIPRALSLYCKVRVP